MNKRGTWSPIIVFADASSVITQRLDPGPPYRGAREGSASFVRSVLRYAPIQRAIVLSTSREKAWLSEQIRCSEWQSIVDVLTFADFCERKFDSDVIIQCTTPSLIRGVTLRQTAAQAKSPWPIVGLTHDLSDPAIFRDLLLAHAAGIRGGDAIFCSSRVAKYTMKKLVTQVAHLLRSRKSELMLPLIPYGIQLTAYKIYNKSLAKNVLALPQNGFIFLFFGRFSQHTKADLTELIVLFSRLFASSNMFLLLAGSAIEADDLSYVAVLENLVSSLAMSAQIKFFINPNVDRKYVLFSASDVFVSPANSLQESFGLTLLEAMVYSLPTIVSDWNGYRDIVVHGETGFLITTKLASDLEFACKEIPFSEPGYHLHLSDKVLIDYAQLSRYLLLFEKNRSLAQRMGCKGNARVAEHFNWARIVARQHKWWRHLSKQAQMSASDRKSWSPNVDYHVLFRHYASRKPRPNTPTGAADSPAPEEPPNAADIYEYGNDDCDRNL